MATTEQLKREIERLKNRQQSKADIKKIGRERKALVQEIVDLRNPKTTVFKKNLAKGVRVGGRGLLKFLDNITEPAPIQKRKKKRR